MGDEVSSSRFTREERQRYREKVQLCLDVFERMLTSDVVSFDSDDPLTGLEMELNLVGADYMPALVNMQVLEEIADPDYQTELGAYNIELNVPPRRLPATCSCWRPTCGPASTPRRRRRTASARSIVMVGILPTVMPEHLSRENWMSPSARYQALNDSILAARGEDMHLDIHGVERLSTYFQTLAPESACTSVQLHVQVDPQQFAPTWNAAQVLAGPQVALGANSPYFFGRELWPRDADRAVPAGHRHPPAGAAQPGRAAAGVVRRALDHLDLRPVRGERALLPGAAAGGHATRTRSPSSTPARRRSCRSCGCTTARSTAGTGRSTPWWTAGRTCGWRTGCCRPGPTVVDVVANAAFFHGALLALLPRRAAGVVEDDVPDARRRTSALPRYGLDARVYWPGLGEVTVDELILRRLLPLAHEGLAGAGVDAALRDRYLDIIEQRVKPGRNGAAWQVATVAGPGGPRRGPDGRAGRAWWSGTATACTATNRCTPGSSRADASPARAVAAVP